jgi:hypothetical protein
MRSFLSVGRLALPGIPGTCFPHRCEIISTMFLRLALELPPFRVELSRFQLPERLLEPDTQPSVVRQERRDEGTDKGQGPFAQA